MEHIKTILQRKWEKMTTMEEEHQILGSAREKVYCETCLADGINKPFNTHKALLRHLDHHQMMLKNDVAIINKDKHK